MAAVKGGPRRGGGGRSLRSPSAGVACRYGRHTLRLARGGGGLSHAEVVRRAVQPARLERRMDVCSRGAGGGGRDGATGSRGVASAGSGSRGAGGGGTDGATGSRGGLRRLRFARGGAGRDRLDRGGLRGAPARRKLGRSPALPRRQRWWDEQVNYQGLKLSESRGEVAYLRGQFRYVGGAFRSCGARRGWGSVIQSGSAVDAEGTVTRRLPATIRTGPRRRHVGIHLHLAAILKSLPPNYPIPLTAAGGAPMGTLRGRLLHFRDAPPKGGVLQR